MDQIEEVKRKIDIVDLIGVYVSLKRGGRNLKGLCPFHGEKSPSFMVSPELQIYKCFGCQKGGDVFGFLQEIEGIEFSEALGILAERAGVKLERMGQRDDEKTEMIKVQEQAADYYHYLLTKHKVGEKALKYLEDRKIGMKLVEQFRIGFALDSWDGLGKYLRVKKRTRVELLEKAGLVIKGQKGFYDRFRGRVIFPLMDGRGRVIAFAGRVVPGVSDREDEPKYINSPETPVYHKSETLFGLYQAKSFIKKADRVVVVEGELDMISSFAAGVGETVAIKGSALTEEQIVMLGRLTKNVILALDADDAGQAAMKRGIDLAERAGMNVKVAKVEGGKDPDDIARENPTKWKQMLEKTVDIYDFYIRLGLQGNDVKTVEGKRRFTAEVLPVIARIENRVVRSFYIRKIAELLGVGEEGVEEEVVRVVKTIKVGGGEQVKKEEGVGQRPRQEMLEEELLSLIWTANKDQSLIWGRLLMAERVDGARGKIVERWVSSGGEVGVAEFIKQLPAELREVGQAAYLKEVNVDQIDRNWVEAHREWEKLVARKRLADLAKRIKQVEEGGDEDIKVLEGEFLNWTKRLSVANNDSG